MNGAVIYQSKHGTALQYAQWISESLQMPLFGAKKIRPEELTSLTHVVFCSPVYFGRLLISGFIKKNWNVLQGKKIYLIISAAVEEDAIKDIQNMVDLNLDPDFQKQIKWFYLGGRMQIDKLSFFEKIIVSGLSKMIKDPREKSKLEKGYDMVDRKKLEPVIEIIKKDK